MMKTPTFFFESILSFLLISTSLLAQPKPRARDLGIPLDGSPGPWNAITDVGGIEVGHTTLIEGEGRLRVGDGPIRTGVTVILPRGKASNDPVFAGWFSLNGNGEMTGTTWIEESGFLEGPIAITNTHSVGTVRDAIIAWQASNDFLFQPWSLPVVAETYDGYLNDINGFHVKAAHVVQALDQATTGPVAEGNVGGGTGMICYTFKGGIGTSSRKLSSESGGYVVGALVQANFGSRAQLMITGAPVGREITEGIPERSGNDGEGSIIIVVATDAPLLPHQLKRLARRASLGVARTGAISSNFSGDIFVALSTANTAAAGAEDLARLQMVPNARLNPIFQATVEATEEAIINALVAAETMAGIDDHRIIALPHDRLKEVLRKYNRLTE
jgi:L-aminopeptidase/D-esterase-like protein